MSHKKVFNKQQLTYQVSTKDFETYGYTLLYHSQEVGRGSGYASYQKAQAAAKAAKARYINFQNNLQKEKPLSTKESNFTY